MTDVAAIVVTHDSAAELGGCVEALLASRGDATLEVVVCDSGSRDSVAEVAATLPVTFVPGPNRGFAAANNRALALDVVNEARYVLFVNPDARVTAGTLADLVSACDAHPGGGVFGVRLRDEHGALIHNIGLEPAPAQYWSAAVSGWGDWCWDSDRYAEASRCDWVEGSFMLVRGEALRALGGFDERFFLYSEEVDLCTRARRAGWEVWRLPVLDAEHRVAGRPFDRHRARLLAWSKLRYIDKWYGRWSGLSMRAALVVFYAHQIWHRRRDRVPATLEWTQLGATLRFRAALYGPATGTASGD